MPPPNLAQDDAAQGELSTPSEQLGRYLKALRRRWKLAALIVALAALTGFLFAATRDPVYEASARVLLGQQEQVDVALGAPSGTNDPERDVNTELQLVTIEPIAEAVLARLRLDLSVSDLQEKVTSATESNSRLVSITARDGDPRRAARIANAFTREYQRYQARSAGQRFRRASAQIRQALRVLEARGQGDSASAERLRDRIGRLDELASAQTGGVEIVRDASPPTAPANASPLRTGILAGLLGLVLAAGTILLLARFDDRLEDSDDVERALRLPVLASLHGDRGGVARGGADEGYRSLAAWLAFSRLGARHSVILLTPTAPDEATGPIALELAKALGEIGRRAIAIEADFSAPTGFAESHGIATDVGLGPVLMGRNTLDENLIDLGMSRNGSANGVDAVNGGSGGAWILPAGAPPRHVQALLAGRAMASLIERARARADFVIVAGAPLTRVGDVLPLVPLVDWTLLAVRATTTTRDAARRARRALESVDAPLLGAVIVGAASRTPARSGRPPSGDAPLAQPPEQRNGRRQATPGAVRAPRPAAGAGGRQEDLS